MNVCSDIGGPHARHVRITGSEDAALFAALRRAGQRSQQLPAPAGRTRRDVAIADEFG
jgi:hypothetical protein